MSKSQSSKRAPQPPQPPKKKPRENFNRFFTEKQSSVEEGSSSTDSGPKNDGSTAHVKEPTPSHSKSCTENDQNKLSNEQLLHMVQSMSAAFAVAINHLHSNCETIRLRRTKATLGVNDESVPDSAAHLLAMFNKYNLPLETKEEIENLDAELGMSNDFLKFFVSPFF